MSDLVERLRTVGIGRNFKIFAVCNEAAARIEALQAALREAREPLAELTIAYQDADSPAIQDTLRRARAALAPERDKCE